MYCTQLLSVSATYPGHLHGLKKFGGTVQSTRCANESLARPTWFCRGYNGKKSPVTQPGIDPGTVRLVAQCLNHYATPDPTV